jgi:gliding motility-associated-like protein
MTFRTFFLALLFLHGAAISKNNAIGDTESPPLVQMAMPVINNLDSIIFDLASSTLSANFIDIPIYIISDDVIFGIDYALKFNLNKLIFSSTIDLLPSDPSIVSLSYFNPNDLFLRYTATSLNSFPNNGIKVTKIRFNLSSPCIEINAQDFTDVLAQLNGTQCSYRITSLNFNKFIPTAGFQSGPSCLNAPIQFSDTSVVSNGSVNNWIWYFNNGDTSLVQNPTTTYTSTGSATATLLITTNLGCKDTLVQTFNINVLPTSGFTFSFDCVRDSVFFSNTSSISSGSILSSLWNFGDQSGTSNLTNPGYHYNASILYTVTLISTSDFSCTGTSTAQVDLTNKVSADFGTTSFSNCIGSIINFYDSTTYALNVITAWIWNFGDGNTSVLQNPSHSFTQSGTYSVNLKSSSPDGCNGFITKIVVIDPTPSPQFATSSATTCASDTVKFNNLSTTIPGSAFSWNFGDGSSSALFNPVHIYTSSSIFPIRLVVTTPGGCKDSITVAYTVAFPPPETAVFTQTVIANAVVSFTNLTENSKQVLWNFGDNTTSTKRNPTHTFSEKGNYIVCLTSSDSLNCISEVCKEIYVGLTKVVAVPSCFTPNNDGSNDLLKVLGGPLSEMKFQIFNQWGNLVFSSTEQDTGWDGTLNGEPQPVGAYKYILNCKTLENQPINLYGIVNLTK